MKKFVLFFLLLMSIFSVTAFAQNEEAEQFIKEQIDKLQIDQIDEMIDENISPYVNGRSVRDLLYDIVTGREKFDIKSIVDSFKEIIMAQAKGVLKGGTAIVAILISLSLLYAMTDGGEGQTSKAVSTVAMLCLLSIVLPVFSGIIHDGVLSLEKMTVLLRVLLPVIGMLMAAGGKILTSAAIPVSVLITIGILNELVKNIFLPLVCAFTAVACADCVYGGKGLDKVAGFLKGLFSWGLGLVLTIFTAVITLQKAALSISDNISVSTVKYAVSNGIPFVGKILSDTVEIVMGCASAVKNGLGILGIVLVLILCLLPIVKAGIYCILYRFFSVIGSLLGDKASGRIFEVFYSSCAMLFTLNCSVCVFFIIVMSVFSVGR